MADDTILETRGLTKEFKGFVAVRNVNLAVRRGTIHALIGPNGAGKSTLMLHLNGIHAPTHGTVRIGGSLVDRSTVKRIRAEVGLVFQDPDDQLFSPTVFEDVAFGPIHLGMGRDEVHERVERALAAVGMTGFERRIPHRLSLGQRKRVALATVLSMDPSVLVFDEPSAGLDPVVSAELDELILRLRDSMNISIVVVTHELESAFKIADHITVLDRGEILLTDTVENVRRSDHARIRSLINRIPDTGPVDADAYLERLTRTD